MIKLTQYSHGSGCGCKIAPGKLEEILATSSPTTALYPQLLVGNEAKDDAAAYALGDGRAVISTTDFFMPIVDDPFEFGEIAATNAISDIYAMGGTPLLAIAIFGWPMDKLGTDVAAQVIAGGRHTCDQAAIPLAGGHSIDAPEPIFGLAVTGIIESRFLKQNSTATAGCRLYLTKPIGIGILTTAEKKGVLQPQHRGLASAVMRQLNRIGTQLATLEGVTAMTDVTGFGLLGHLLEMCEGSAIRARIDFAAIPRLDAVEHYLALDCSPGGAGRNFASYGHKAAPLSPLQQQLLCDPQTSGGLLIAVTPEGEKEMLEVTRAAGLELKPIGETLAADANTPLVEVW
ncbi:MAG: selenide, water dikinase SelD [Gammaproteobacteria bacterium]|nr:selenide, water dikinase SelD [Gammaproteobacteria bacterium]